MRASHAVKKIGYASNFSDVTLINTSDTTVDLAGWHLQDN
jgi:hypothetical protein